ncbi:hypothetical protein GXW82_02440 [Streptacidiphilus sp. 4-A2]|nr:hypothetical protein [Streptacidiphilus sp. 4-A2]
MTSPGRPGIRHQRRDTDHRRRGRVAEQHPGGNTFSGRPTARRRSSARSTPPAASAAARCRSSLRRRRGRQRQPDLRAQAHRPGPCGALVATTAFDYAGASYVSAQRVPTSGGQPIGTAYDQYPYLYQIYGSSEPRDRSVGWNGTEYQTTEVYRYFKQKIGLHNAAVVAYNQADSTRYAAQLVQGLTAEGTSANETVTSPCRTSSAVATGMKSAGTQLLMDAMDTTGQCGLAVHASAGCRWRRRYQCAELVAQAGSDYSGVPGCLNALWATADSRSYTAPATRPSPPSAHAALLPERQPLLSQWEGGVGSGAVVHRRGRLLAAPRSTGPA